MIPIDLAQAGKEEILPLPQQALPYYLPSFIDRINEIGEVIHLIQSNRLLTIIGISGVGKTRLSIETARKISGNFLHGVCYLDLTGLSSWNQVDDLIANHLNLSIQTDTSGEWMLMELLKPRQMLLILDNCENLTGDGSKFFNHLLENCPNLKILAISQELLGIPGEITYLLAPFEVPDIFANPQVIKNHLQWSYSWIAYLD